MILVVGLGNPGEKYARTRHNVGFDVADLVAGPGASFRGKFNAELAAAEIRGHPVMVLKPQTYMNESGRSVQPAAQFYKLGAGDIVVVHDDIDLPFGTVRLKRGGGDAGHKGLKSIRSRLGTGEFVRVRVGVGRPPEDFRGDVADFVLQAFASLERARLGQVLDRAAGAVELVVQGGLEKAIETVHQQNPRPERGIQNDTSNEKDEPN